MGGKAEEGGGGRLPCREEGSSDRGGGAGKPDEVRELEIFDVGDCTQLEKGGDGRRMVVDEVLFARGLR